MAVVGLMIQAARMDKPIETNMDHEMEDGLVKAMVLDSSYNQVLGVILKSVPFDSQQRRKNHPQ